MKLNLTTILIVVGIVVLTLKFRNELTGFLVKIPLVGSLVA
jgi:type II secretory pathway component PulF